MRRPERVAGDRGAARPRRDRGRADRHPRRVPGREGRRAGARRGEDLAAEPGLAARRALRRRARGRADARSLRGAGRQGDDARRRGRRGRAPPGPRARAGGERAPARGGQRHGRVRRRARAARRARRASTGRSSTPRARGSARSRPAPTCAGAPSRCRSSSSPSCAPRPSGSSPAARSCTRSARSTRTRTRPSSTRPGSPVEPLGDGVARVPAPAPARVPPHAAASRPNVGVLCRPTQGLGSPSCPGTTGFARSRSSPRSMRPTSRNLGEQLEVLLRAGARVFHFDVGDGHFVPPITIGPIVLQSISPIVHQLGGVLDCHLMVEQPEQALRRDRRGGRRQRHLPLRGRLRRRRHDPRGPAARARGRDRVQPGDRARDGRRGRRRRRPRPLHEHPSRLLGPGVHARVARADRPAARGAAPDGVHVQVDGGVNPENVLARVRGGADLIVAGASIFSREDLPRAYRRLVHALAGPAE